MFTFHTDYFSSQPAFNLAAERRCFCKLFVQNELCVRLKEIVCFGILIAQLK